MRHLSSRHIIPENNGVELTLGRIVVHDRSRVESEVLPRYFNHASFASLRRQLNYFNFARIGKGRQRGATYCNENVVKLEDILRLKRRGVGSPTPTVDQTSMASQINQNKKIHSDSGNKLNCEHGHAVMPGPFTDGEAPTSFATGFTLYGSERIFSKETHEGIQCQEKANALYIQQEQNQVEVSKTTNKKSLSKKRGRNLVTNSIVPVVHLPPKKKKIEGSSLYLSSIYSSNNGKNRSQFMNSAKNSMEDLRGCNGILQQKDDVVTSNSLVAAHQSSSIQTNVKSDNAMLLPPSSQQQPFGFLPLNKSNSGLPVIKSTSFEALPSSGSCPSLASSNSNSTQESDQEEMLAGEDDFFACNVLLTLSCRASDFIKCNN